MSKLELLNQNGEKVKDIKLNDNVFGIEPNDTVLHDAVVLAMANARQGTHSTKTRAEVSGGGRKPWRQKGTGNARQGSIRAVQWRKGGIAFGPKPRDYSKKQNKKERRLALLSALSYKAKENEVVVLDAIKFETNKTKEMVNLLNKLELEYAKVLLVVTELDDNICLSSRNLGNVKVVLPTEVNTYDVLNSDKMVLTEAALKNLEEVLKNE
jgi:large subunit ribosomal protein L4